MTSQNLPGSNLVFNESFYNSTTVANNGGVVISTPTINNFLQFTGTNTQAISYPNLLLGNGRAKMSWRIKFKIPSNSLNYLFSRLNATECNFHFTTLAANGNFDIYIGSLSNRVMCMTKSFCDNAVHDLFLVYDGSQSTNITKIKLYEDINGTITQLTLTNSAGTIPTTLPVQGVGTGIGIQYPTTYWSATGTIIYKVQSWDNISLSTEEMTDIVQQDTISEISPKKALLYLPLKNWYYKENGTQLLVDGDMEAAGTAAWANYASATITKETTSPHSGSQCIRCYGVAGAGQGIKQTILGSGLRYKITGYARSDGTRLPLIYIGGANVSWTGTNSTSWQEFNFEVIADGVNCLFLKNSLTGYVEFDDLRIELMEARTNNIGSLGGYSLLGDGSTTSTFPTQLAPKGVSFDTNAKYIDTKLVGLFSRITPFTLAFLLNYKNTVIAWSLAGTRVEGATSAGLDIQINAPCTVILTLAYDGGTNIYIQVSSVFAGQGIKSIIITYDGSGLASGINFYNNGNLNTKVISKDTLGVYDFTTPISFRVGRRYLTGVGGASATENLHNCAMYNYVLTPQQAKILHSQLIKNINTK